MIKDGRKVGLGSNSSSDIIIVTVVVLSLRSYRSLLSPSLAAAVVVAGSITGVLQPLLVEGTATAYPQ